MYNPVITYRIQFHKGFNFNDFEHIIPYLEQLGVGTIYASPIFQSTPGSMHGYDTVNPLRINSEIGTIAQLRSISKKLKEKNIGWIQDIVPNHMAFHSDNEWLMDLLKNGKDSDYKAFFDQSLSSDLYKNAIMVPFLGETLDDAINAGTIQIAKIEDSLYLTYADQHWPLNIPIDGDEIAEINQDKTKLLKIASGQYYRLCSWKETDTRINFRRFFTVNSLICLNMQNEEVFKTFHGLILKLLREGIFNGLRVDHVDGLYDPSNYLKSLRKLAGDDTYIVVEKILAKNEQLQQWPIQGTTGYEFLAQVNNLLTNLKSEKQFSKFYNELTGKHQSIKQQVLDKKAYILNHHMQGELDNLTNLFIHIHKSHLDKEKLKQAIALLLIHWPVYRYYGNEFPLKGDEADNVRKVFSDIRYDHKDLMPVFDVLEHAILGTNKKYLEFYMRCMQFTGPLMAKGVEDTLMYTYERFSAHNEVGDAPGAFGITAAEFHELMQQRQQQWPFALNASATHDTKRGEDVRARLNVLPDIAAEWFKTINEWRQMNRSLKQVGAPDANDEYLIYQTLIGAYPMPGESEDNFKERLQQYLEKTMREAKLHSDWGEPNAQYEQAVEQFAVKLLDNKRPFWKSFTNFQAKVADLGIVNSLAQVMLKFTCPGVPDVYQGCEHWDFSLVDPDNRRPVDYSLREKLLKSLSITDPASLWENRFNGQVKLWLVNELIQVRKINPLLFAYGDYIPLQVEGRYKQHIFAFARSYKREWFISILPLGIAALCESQSQPINGIDWADTTVILPADAPTQFQNILQKTSGEFKRPIEIKSVFEKMPIAFIKLQHPENNRGAGILMHITSLPSPFDIGDFGPEAIAFADMLHRCDQKYWQLLPLSPVEAQNQYSPYSSFSAMAGNVLLISPKLLVNDGLLVEEDIEKRKSTGINKVNYKHAAKIKQQLFTIVWNNFQSDHDSFLQPLFTGFCQNESAWLDDFSLYVVIKLKHNNQPWYKWPDELKHKDKKALADFINDNQDAIDREKFLQFLFSRQWQQLKGYCNKLDIKLFGDLPFYVSYDSVDVWSHPEIFNLDDEGNMQYVAGVPPDYFSKDGQLWGMPVFRWDNLKEQRYSWWIQRFKKNLELFDLLRLDHFRAFSSYWSVPANEKTAKNGTWEQGPGADLFNTLKKELGELPFVAEDLGDIDDSVYHLRDEFGWPGMRVLQFAFGAQLPYSPHIPQNYTKNSVAYTGTHDNNTTKGWFMHEADEDAGNQIKAYTGVKAKPKNIHKVFIRSVMASAAKIVIIPMQDVLGLDETTRINVPGLNKGNWLWLYEPNHQQTKAEKQLKKWTWFYNRQ